MRRYSIGIDYGTLSGRAVLVDVETGEERASAVYDYPHGVMDECLPDGRKLGPDWALQHPQDYLDVLAHTIPALLRQAGAKPEEVVGVGTDFTACTVLPVKADGTPLCFLPEYAGNPHAYVKLWKHHAAQDQANRLNALAARRGEGWLARYGGKISSEWEFPKLLQIVEEAPELYDAMDSFVEAADWIVWQLTGEPSRNSCTAGYKAIWSKEAGYPSEAFFGELHPKLRYVIREKYACPVTPLGRRAGGLSKAAAALTGLVEGTAVSVGNVDAHVCVPAVKIEGPGKMLAIMGTSTCHMLLGEREKMVPGMCGVVEDGILPGFFGYEAGQSCVGDHFAWFIDNCLPSAYTEEAKSRGMNLHALMRESGSPLPWRKRPGGAGLVERQPVCAGGCGSDRIACGHDPANPAGGDLPGADRGHGLRHQENCGNLPSGRRGGGGVLCGRRDFPEGSSDHADICGCAEYAGAYRGISSGTGAGICHLRSGSGGPCRRGLRHRGGGFQDHGPFEGGAVSPRSLQGGDIRPAV